MIDSVLLDIILIIVFAIVGVFLLSRGNTAAANGMIFLIAGAIMLLVAVYIALVVAGIT